jgi:hypothetical protein
MCAGAHVQEAALERGLPRNEARLAPCRSSPGTGAATDGLPSGVGRTGLLFGVRDRGGVAAELAARPGASGRHAEGMRCGGRAMLPGTGSVAMPERDAPARAARGVGRRRRKRRGGQFLPLAAAATRYGRRRPLAEIATTRSSALTVRSGARSARAAERTRRTRGRPRDSSRGRAPRHLACAAAGRSASAADDRPGGRPRIGAVGFSPYPLHPPRPPCGQASFRVRRVGSPTGARFDASAASISGAPAVRRVCRRHGDGRLQMPIPRRRSVTRSWVARRDAAGRRAGTWRLSSGAPVRSGASGHDRAPRLR